MDEYLPHQTKEWCAENIKQMGHQKGRVSGGEAYASGERAHSIVYRQLREKVHDHIQSQLLPQLIEAEKPTGAWQWNLPSEIQQHARGNMQDSSGMDIYNEGCDEGYSEIIVEEELSDML